MLDTSYTWAASPFMFTQRSRCESDIGDRENCVLAKLDTEEAGRTLAEKRLGRVPRTSRLRVRVNGTACTHTTEELLIAGFRG